jgi:putative Mn2+ efflux pump MntP
MGNFFALLIGFSVLILLGYVAVYPAMKKKKKEPSPEELEKQRLQEEWKEQQKGYKNN